jgi:hypothetical protein
MTTRIQQSKQFYLALTFPLVACALFVLTIIGGAPALATETAAPSSLERAALAPQTTGTPCGPTAGWSRVPAPDGGSYSNALYGVAAISSNDAWAVGEQYSSGLSSYVPMIEHWNGAAWSVVQASQYGISLRAVTAISSDDVWAVGWMGGYSSQPLAEHWDGSQWSYVQASASGARKLYGVAAVSTNDVWAVGQSNTGILILHWNGAQWSASPAPSIPSGILYGATATSANDVWAVGTANNAETVILHWDGTQWTRVASPNSGAYINVLTSVSAASSDNIWAVGYWATSGVEYHGYSLHWDGAQWSAAINPTSPGESQGSTQPDDPTPTGVYLYGVSAAPDGQVWMVGRNLQTNGATPITMRFDGDSWTLSPNDKPGIANTNLYAVTAASADSMWAVGNYDTSSYGYTMPLIERYGDGCAAETATATPALPTATPTACASGVQYSITRTTEASIVPGTVEIGIDCQFNCTKTIDLPFPFTLYDRTFTSAIVGSNGVLAFLRNDNPMEPTCLPSASFDYAIVPDWELLVYRYEPESSDKLPSHEAPVDAGVWVSVTGTAPNRVFNIEWRAKDRYNVSPVNFEVRLYENSPEGRFDIIYAAVNHHGGHASVGVQMDTGSRWTQFSCLRQGQIERGVQLTFVQNQCGTQSSPTAQATTPPAATNTAVPAATGTPILPTSTQSAATSTAVATSDPGEPTATPTTCSVQFSDVEPGSTFYSQVDCLACQGVMSGYDDGTFRPNNEVTRGQLSKIVANSAGYNDPVSGQTFEDVDPTSTFYLYIERMSSKGVIGGYPCGGEGEPCGPENRPYFRPFANATRGQIAKVVSSAAGFDTTPAAQMFEDVPVDNAFYAWVERLASREIMGGYECGGEGEPCGPENRPYFRPYRNATRGQSAKIVANSFFPNCTTR